MTARKRRHSRKTYLVVHGTRIYLLCIHAAGHAVKQEARDMKAEMAGHEIRQQCHCHEANKSSLAPCFQRQGMIRVSKLKLFSGGRRHGD